MSRRTLQSTLLSVLVTALAIVTHAQTNTALPPQLTCAALKDDGTPWGVGEAATFSNLTRIPIRVTLVGSPASLMPLRLAGQTAVVGSPAPPTLSITVAHVSGPTRSPVDTKFLPVATSRELKRQSLEVLTEIPIDAATRRRNVERTLALTETESRRTGRLEIFRHLTSDRELLIAALERFYMENRTGEFEIACTYSAHQPGFWIGTVSSTSGTRVRVVFDKGFFEQLGFPQP